MLDGTAPARAVVGDTIECDFVPGFRTEVLAGEPCETDAHRTEAHNRYQVIDPEGNKDWLCAYEVCIVSKVSPR